MASEFLNKGIGHRNIVTIVDFGSYESQVVLLAGLLVGATLAPLGHTNFYKFNNSKYETIILIQYYTDQQDNNAVTDNIK